MNEQERKARGERARVLLNDDLVKGAFEELEATYTRKWKESAFGDAEGREQLFRYVHVLRQFRAHFEALIRDGDLARAEIERRMTGRLRNP